ncbi:MAG TPA: hypothetical protein VGT40_10490 [Methylomirabilota bacterium]|nr:hypothetical protein [Methylomirabilota bacterium]
MGDIPHWQASEPPIGKPEKGCPRAAMTPAGWKSIPLLSLAALGALVAAVSAADLNGRTPKSSRPEPSNSLFIVRQQAEGEIAKLDPAGIVVIKTRSGRLTMAAPQLSAVSAAQGDRVLVEVGILPATSRPTPASSPQARDRSDPAILRQRLQSQVISVDLSKGVLMLQTPSGRVRVDLPSNVLEQFRKGDLVPIELAVILQPSPEKVERAGLAALLLSIFGKK